MHQKLRHQLNIHKISRSYKTINLCILLTFFIFYFLFIKKTNNKHAFKKKRVVLTKHVW
jgi:hypothetical protein